ETAVRRKMKLRLLAHLERPQPGGRDPAERLPLTAQSEDILGVTVRKVTIPVAAGIVTLRTVTPRMSSDCAVSGRRSAGSRPPGCGRSRCASRRSFILRRTAV